MLQGNRAAARNLSSKINKVDHDSLKQQEIIYNQVCQYFSSFLVNKDKQNLNTP